MHRVLRFKHHLRPEPLDEERVFLIAERARFLLEGRVHALVAPLVDGRRSVGEIIEALSDRASAPEVYYALTRLEERGYLAEVAAELPPDEAGFWESLGVPAALAAERLATTAVAVQALGQGDTAPLVEALRAAGVVVDSRDRDGAGVQVVLTEDYLAPAIERWSREVRPDARWMLVKATGGEPWIGPVFGARGAACWACLASRLRDNRPVETYLEERRAAPARVTAPRVGLRASASAALYLAALALARWIVDGGRGLLDDHLVSFDAGSLREGRHRVTRRPQCPACGDPEMGRARALGPIVLASRPKRFTADGGHRVMPPEETLARNEHLVSPITGVISDLRPIGDDPLRPIYSAVFRVRPANLAPSFADFHHVASGKGRTAAQARAGALCEAIERRSAVFRGDEPRERARLSELGPPAVHPRALQGFSEAQYRQRTGAGPREAPQRAVPLPYEGDAPLDWTPVWSLTNEQRRWVPTSFCYLHAPAAPDGPFCSWNSNGHAAGNCVEEAILQGFFELVERDAVAVWWYNRLRRPAVDLASFDVPYFTALVEQYRSTGFDLCVLDLTHDLEIPVFVAAARQPSTGRIWVGCGCHFDAGLAVQRALTEVNQCLDPDDRTRAPWDAAAFGEPLFLAPDAALPARGRDDFPAACRADLRDDVRACVERAARAGLETLVLDQTRPDLGLCAVKVIVPGLRHFWPRLGPGRLYDVPVRMGWRDAPLEEAQLNPAPFFF